MKSWFGVSVLALLILTSWLSNISFNHCRIFAQAQLVEGQAVPVCGVRDRHINLVASRPCSSSVNEGVSRVVSISDKHDVPGLFTGGAEWLTHGSIIEYSEGNVAQLNGLLRSGNQIWALSLSFSGRQNKSTSSLAANHGIYCLHTHTHTHTNKHIHSNTHTHKI